MGTKKSYQIRQINEELNCFPYDEMRTMKLSRKELLSMLVLLDLDKSPPGPRRKQRKRHKKTKKPNLPNVVGNVHGSKFDSVTCCV